MPHDLIVTAVLTAAATSGHHFHIGPWIIVPILILVAIIGTPIYVIRDRKRRATVRTK